MSNARSVGSIVLLVVEGGLAVLGGLVAFGLTAEYGVIGASRNETFADAMGIGVIALVIVGAVGLVASSVARSRRVTAVAAAIPVLMLLGIWLTGPLALDEKLDVQYDASPQCLDAEMTTGPGADAAREAQATFDSIDHVGWFGGGGGSGVGGCDRTLTLVEETDVVGHYSEVLTADGWTVVEDEPGLLRAERGATAFEVTGQGSEWTVWTGPVRGGVTHSSGRVAP
jgi:hypothetical protein